MVRWGARDAIKSRWQLIFIFVFMGGVPVLGAFSGSPHNTERLIELLILMVASFYLLFDFHISGFGRVQVLVFQLLVGFFVLGILGAIFAAEPLIALREWAVFAGLFALVWRVSKITSQGFDDFSIAITVSSLAYFSCVVLLLAMVVANRDVLQSWDLVVGYDNPRFLNHVQVVMIPLLSGCVLNERGRSSRTVWAKLAWLALIGQFALMFMTYGRASTLSSVFAVMIVFILVGWRVFAISKIMMLGAVGGGFLYVLLFRIVPNVLGAGVAGLQPEGADIVADHSRYFLWNIALKQIAAHPFLGLGPMHYAHFPNRAGAHPHNIYLQLGVEWGLLALVLVLFAVGLCLWVIRNRLIAQNVKPEAIQLAAFVACVAAMVDGLFSGNMVMPMSQLWIATAAGMALHGGGGARVGLRPGFYARVTRPLVFTVLLFVQADCFYRSALEYRLPEPSLLQRQPTDNVGSLDRPRFWRRGWF